MTDILQKIREGEIPDHARDAIIKGLLPLESEELITAIYIICSQAESYLHEARSTFDGMPDGIKKAYFEDRRLEEGISSFYLMHFQLPLEAKSAALLNPKTSGEAIAHSAPELEPQLIDLAVNNQVKILEFPGIVEALRQNSQLSINQKQKLDEYGRLLLKNKISPPEELEHLTTKEIEDAAIDETKAFVQAFGKEPGAMPKTSAAAAQRAGGKQQTQDRISVLEQIANMSVPQKVQAAIKGDREVRSTLVKDNNKMVCTAVIKSPRITESEVEFYANLRNVQTEVLRMIAMNREWLKSYKIVLNLVKNPRTPLAFTIKLLNRLNKKDLRNLVNDRGIPEALRTMARRMTRPA